MGSGILFTSLVSLLIFASSFAAAIAIFKKRREVEDFFFPYSLFLFFTSGLWFFVFLRLFFAWLGARPYDELFFVVGQISLFFSAPPLAYCLVLKISRSAKLAKVVGLIFGVAALVALYFVINDGVIESGFTYFVTKYQLSPRAFSLFVLIVVPLMIVVFFDSFKGLIQWLINRQKNKPQIFVYTFLIFIYLGLGILDEQGLIAGWWLVIFRLIFTAVFLMVYVVFQSQFQPPKQDSQADKAIEKAVEKTEKSAPNLFVKRTNIFRKMLGVLLFLSLVPVVFSSFLIISTYQGTLSDIEKGIVPIGVNQLKENVFIQTFLILFLLVILVIFAAVLIARSVTRPLSDLVRGVKQVTKGNLNVKFTVYSKDEVGELVLAFNEMTEKLREQRERENLVAKLKTEFISIAAHQLRTPLSSVKWILRMLLDGDFGVLSDKQREFAEKGYGANDRMIHLVNDLLDTARIEEGRYGFEFGQHDFKRFLRELVESFKEDAKMFKLKWELSLPEENLTLFFDSERLRMAIGNIIGNALRYTKEGEVEVLVVKKPDFAEVAVKDTGVGIPLHQRDRVFTKFFRGDNVVRMQTEGTGLGLYLAKNIIEKHGGEVWFESEEGKGSTFYFTIPTETTVFPKD